MFRSTSALSKVPMFFEKTKTKTRFKKGAYFVWLEGKKLTLVVEAARVKVSNALEIAAFPLFDCVTATGGEGSV